MDAIPSPAALITVAGNVIAEQQLQNAVVYVFRELLHPDRSYKMNRREIDVEKPSALLFVDLEPGVNWSHACLYILYDGANVKTIEGGFPPPAKDLLLLSKPGIVEDWMLLSKEKYK